MHNAELARLLGQLTTDPSPDPTDLWPVVERRVARRRRRTARRLRPLLAGATVLVVAATALSAALFLNRPQPVSAAEVLDQVQTEALQASTDAGACGRESGAKTGTGGTAPAQPGAATELSDRLAQALGVSGDRMRQAMLETMCADMPQVSWDPMQAIAQQLGVSPEQVSAAFANPQTPGHTAVGLQVSDQDGSRSVKLNLNGTRIDVDHIDTGQLNGPAQQLGVSPDRLAQAIRMAVPAPAELPKQSSEDEIITRLAQNLGKSPDQVRAAITQVEGSGPFYFAVRTIQGFGKH